MKEVVYTNGGERTEYNLTNKEFAEASPAWAKKESYYCYRLERILSPYFQTAGTKKGETGFDEILLAFDSDCIRKYMKLGADYYFHFTSGTRKVKLSDEQIKKLVPEEKYYEGKKLLNE